MFLERILSEVMGAQAKSYLQIVIYQINLLLCLVNDILDLKLIEEKQFEQKIESFKLRECFSFISNMFATASARISARISGRETSRESSWLRDESAEGMAAQPASRQARTSSTSSKPSSSSTCEQGLQTMSGSV